MLIVLRDKGERHRKLSFSFSTIIWPVFSRQWQWSRKKARQHVLYRHFPPITTPDRLTATICATDRLTATLCEKTSSDEVPHRKERRRGAARICEKISATSREKSHFLMVYTGNMQKSLESNNFIAYTGMMIRAKAHGFIPMSLCKVIVPF